MGVVTVRVVPRAGRDEVKVGPGGIVIRVREVPEGGRATEAARRTLAAALGVPQSRVVLRLGARSRIKTFEVDGLSDREIEVRLRAT